MKPVKLISDKDILAERSGELFRQYGIRSLNLDVIFRKLGISRKDFHQFFADKNEWVDYAIVKLIEHHKKELQRVMKTGNAVEQALAGRTVIDKLLYEFPIKLRYELKKYHPTIYDHWTEFKENWLLQVCKKNLAAGIKEDFYRQNINIDIISVYLLNLVMEKDAGVFLQTKNYPPEAVKRQLTEFELSGLCTTKGRSFLEDHFSLHTIKVNGNKA